MDSQVISFIDNGWVLLAAALVFFMRAGFLALEAGLTQRKNSANVAAKNLVDLGIAATLFWLYGFGVIFGETSGGLFGTTRFTIDFLQELRNPTVAAPAIGLATFFIYQIMFSNTAVVILSGATAERLRFETYLLLSLIISGLVYPFLGHWVWNGIDAGLATGWLGSRGFIDFAGGTVVHSVGAWASLAVLLVLKPRLGRFAANGAPVDLPKANLPLAVIGTFILWFGWFGFNGGSTLLTSGTVGVVLTNTMIAGAAGLVAVIPIQMLTQGGLVKTDYLLNGALVGLVSITACAHVVPTQSAFLIGLVGAWIMLFLDWLLLRLQIDDAIGAIPVHLGGGVWGTLAVALFGDPLALGTGLNFTAQLAIQITGILATAIWAFGVTLLLTVTINAFFPLRVTPEEERIGLNLSEQGAAPDYTEFPGLEEVLTK